MISSRFISFVAWTALAVFVLIVLGAAIRVTDSGMSCPDWPMCYGKLYPFPLPVGVNYEPYQVMLEWGHRLLAGLVGFAVLAVALLGWRYGGRVRLLSALSLGLLLSQVGFGGLTVLKSNVNWSVAVHLGNAALLFGVLILLRKAAALQLSGAAEVKAGLFESARFARGMLWVFLVGVFCTALLGAMVSSSHAGGVCGGLFSCMGEWLPTEDFTQLLHMKHRFLAFFDVLLVASLWGVTRGDGVAAPLQRTANGLLIMVAVQVVFGVGLLHMFMGMGTAGYPFLSVIHLAWAMLIFMASVGALAKVYWGAGGGFHGSK